MLRIVNKKKRILAQALDRIGFCIFKVLSFVRRDVKKPTEIKNILVIRFAYIGDVILTIPALKPLANRFPDAKICFLTSSKAKAVLENNPYIDEIITYDAPWFYPQKKWSMLREYLELIRVIRSRQFDMVIDFRGDFRNIVLVVFPSGASRKVGYGITGGGYLLTDVVECTDYKHKAEFHLDIVRLLGCNSAPDRMTLYPSPADTKNVEKLLKDMGVKRDHVLVGLQPGGRAPLKCWDVSSFAEVARLLVDRYNATIAVTGGPDEVGLGERLLRLTQREGFNLCGALSLRELQVLLEHVSLLITNDTAALHMASGANTPTIAIFGPSEVWDTGSLSRRHKVIMKQLDCRTSCDTYRCNNAEHHKCLKSIRPSEVVEACAEILKETTGRQ